jgi:hypothetical protein
LADHIITSPGTPGNWAISNATPIDFGLAKSSSQGLSELDLNKINRLKNSSFSTSEFAFSTNLYNTAIGLKVSQILDLNIQQVNNSTSNNFTKFIFTVSTSMNSRPVSTILHAYAKANLFQNDIANYTSASGIGYLSVEIPENDVDNAYLVVFARATIDDRITSYGVYDFKSSTQKFSLDENVLNINGPINNLLTWTLNASTLIVEKAEIFSYGYTQDVLITQGNTYCMLPNLIDPSPQIVILSGLLDGNYFQTWTSNPIIPLEFGSHFDQSEQNIFTYMITIKNNLYKVEISLGDLQS